MRQAYFDPCGLTINLKLADALSVGHHGQCIDDVWALMKAPYVAAQLDALKPDDVRAVLDGCGAWDAEELADHADNVERLLWLAACNVAEEARERHPRMMGRC